MIDVDNEYSPDLYRTTINIPALICWPKGNLFFLKDYSFENFKMR